MPPSDIANVEIDEILDKLSTEEAVNLIAGVGPWHTASIERPGITVPAIKYDSYCADIFMLLN
jgi:beta-glucosidase